MSKSKKSTRPATISEQLRAYLVADGRTAYALAKVAGVNPGMVARFMDGKRDLRLTTADKIGAALGLRLCGPDQ